MQPAGLRTGRGNSARTSRLQKLLIAAPALLVCGLAQAQYSNTYFFGDTWSTRTTSARSRSAWRVRR